MGRIKQFIYTLIGCVLSIDIYAATCAPEYNPASTISGSLVVSELTLGATASAIGGATVETCGLIISDTKSTVKSADFSIKNINVIGGNAVSLVNFTNGAVALGKGTVKGHGFTSESDTSKPNTMMNVAASITGSGSGLMAGGELSKTDPPSGGESQNIRNLSGTVSYNRVDATNTDYLNVAFSKAGVTANALVAFGGTSSANVDLFDSDSLLAVASAQAGDTATSLIATGIKLGDKELAIGDNGAARANSLAVKKVDIRGGAFARAGNQATMLQGHFGTVAANGIDISDTRNINGIAVSMAGNNAAMSSTAGIPLRPMALPETSVVSNNLGIKGGSVNAGSYVFTANSSSVGQALMGGSVKVNSVDLKESNHAGVGTVLNANTGSLLTAFGFSPASSGSSASGSSVTANSVTHDSKSMVTGAAFVLQGNNAVQGMAVMGGKVTNNSLDNGENANMAGVSSVSIGNNALVSSAYMEGNTSINSVKNDGRMMGVATITANNQSMMGLSTGKESNLKVNDIANSGTMAGTNIIVSNNQNPASMVFGGSGNVNTLVNDSNAMMVGGYALMGNTGMVLGSGNSNSIINRGSMIGSGAILNSTGLALMGGTSTSIVNDKGMGTMAGTFSITNSMGHSMGSGSVASSVVNRGAILGSASVANSVGTAVGLGSVASSIDNQGVIFGSANILGGMGTALGGGVASSVVNRGSILGSANVANSIGTAVGPGSVASSIINNGAIFGVANISGNVGMASGGGIASSIVNNGIIQGGAYVIGTTGVAAGRIHGSVVNLGPVASGVGVVGNMPVGGIPVLLPIPTISQSIVVAGPAWAFLF